MKDQNIDLSTTKKPFTLICNGICEELFLILNAQRKTKIFCDVVLQVSGESIHAHSNILSAASPYFRSFLGKGQDDPRAFSQKTPQIIEIHIEGSVDNDGYAESVRRIVDYMYTGKIELTADINYSLLEIAKITEMDKVVDMCEKYKTGNIPANEDNLSCIFPTTDDYELQKRQAKCFDPLPGYAVTKLKDYVTISTQTEMISGRSQTVIGYFDKDCEETPNSSSTGLSDAQRSASEQKVSTVTDENLLLFLGLESTNKTGEVQKEKNPSDQYDHSYDINDGRNPTHRKSKRAVPKHKSKSEPKLLNPSPETKRLKTKDTLLTMKNMSTLSDLIPGAAFEYGTRSKRQRVPNKKYANDDFVSPSKEIKTEPVTDNEEEEIESSEGTCKVANANEPRGEPRLLTCSLCPYTTFSMYHYDRHKMAHSKMTRQYECGICDYKSHSTKLLVAHRLKHIHDLNICSFCDVKTSTAEDLDEHLKKHRGVYKFFCTSCPSRFVNPIKHLVILHLYIYFALCFEPLGLPLFDAKDNLYLYILMF